MKKIIAMSFVFFCCTLMISCTNEEDEDKIEILTPTKDTDGAIESDSLP